MPSNPTDADPFAVVPHHDQAGALQQLAEEAVFWSARARGAGTLRAYRSAWKLYTGWCEHMGLTPLSGNPQWVGWYLTRAAERLAPPSLKVHLSAIVLAHHVAGLALDPRDPKIALVLDGLTRAAAGRRRRQALPIRLDLLRSMLASQPDTATGARNRALLLIGWGGARRRSELVALDIGDVELVENKGVLVTIRRSKTDQYGRGQQVAIWAATDPELCVMRAMQAWLAIRGIKKGTKKDACAPLFVRIKRNGQPGERRLTDQTVCHVVKQAVAAVGLDTTGYSGHSLRAGLLTAGAAIKAPLSSLQQQSHHRSADVLLDYIRSADIWDHNVTRDLFG